MRHYGFLANRCCKRELPCVRAALARDEAPRSRKDPDRQSGPVELTCRVCGKGRLTVDKQLPAIRPWRGNRQGSCLDRPNAGRGNANDDEPGNGAAAALGSQCWNRGPESGTLSPGKPFEARGNAQNERESPTISPDFSGNRHRCGRLENTIPYR